MNEEQRKIFIDVTKQAVREFLEEEKKKTYETIGSWFVNVMLAAAIGFGVYFMLWVEKHKT